MNLLLHKIFGHCFQVLDLVISEVLTMLQSLSLFLTLCCCFESSTKSVKCFECINWPKLWNKKSQTRHYFVFLKPFFNLVSRQLDVNKAEKRLELFKSGSLPSQIFRWLVTVHTRREHTVLYAPIQVHIPGRPYSHWPHRFLGLGRGGGGRSSLLVIYLWL